VKVLVVDDRTDNRYFFETLLKGQGYDAVGAVNGAEALEKLAKDSFDLVISDIMMPVMDGFHLLQECKNNPKLRKIPFIFITGVYMDQEDEELALKLGVRAFLRKPVEPADLIQTVATAISSKPAPARRGRKPKDVKPDKDVKLLEERLSAKLAKKIEELDTASNERKQAEAALRGLEEQYHLLFETMSQGVIFQDAGGRIISANPAALKILGLTDDQITGRTPYDPRWRAIHEDGSDYSGAEHPSMLALKSGETVKNARMGIFNPAEERYHWISIDAVPLTMPGEEKPYRVYTTLTDITESLFAHKAIMESESRLHAVLENTDDAIFSIDRDFRLITANSSAKRHYKDATGHNLIEGMDMLSQVPRERIPFWHSMRDHALKEKRSTFTTRYDMEAGSYDVEFSVFPIVSASGYVTGFSFFGRDVTEKKRAAETINRNSRLFQMLFLCNEAMVHARHEQELLQNICRVLVETGGYRMAWVGYALDDENKTIKPAACFGTDDTYLNSINVSWADNDRGKGPAGKAVRTGHTVICQDIAKDADYQPWYEAASRQGYAGKVSLPLKEAERVFGVLNIYAPSPGFFIEDEVKLLEQLADDMAFGIGSLRADRQRQDAEASLRESEEKYRTVLDEMDEAYYEIDAQGNYTFFNDSLCRQMGYTREELKGLNYKSYTPEQDWKKKVALYSEVFRTGIPAHNVPLVNIKKDGTLLYVEDSILPIRNEKGEITGLRGLAHDISSRRKAEAALRKSEEKYRTILEDMDEAYYEIDAQGNYTFINDSLWKQFGYTRDEMTGMSYKAYTPAEERKKVVSIFSRVFNTGTPAYNELLTFMRKGGELIYVEESIFPIRDEQGTITGLRGLIHDMTERRKSEEELKKRALFLDSAYDSVIAFNQAGDIVYANETASISRGYTVAEMQSMNIRKLVPAENIAILEDRLETIATLGELSFEVIHLAKDGHKLDVEARIRSIDVEGSRLYVAVYRDITARRKMQQELVNSETRYRSIIETAGAAVIAINLAGNLTYVNDLGCETVGYSREELLGKPFSDLVHPDDRSKIVEPFTRTAGTSEVTGKGLALEFRALHRDGSIVWFYANPTRMIVDGETVGFSAVMPNITKLKNAEAALQESEQRYRSLFENNPVSVNMQDAYGRFISVNDATCRITGYSREEILAMPPEKMIVPENVEMGRQHFIRALRGEPQTYEQAIMGKNGNIIILNVTNSSVEVDNKIVGIYSVSEDITERKKAEADLKAALEMVNATLEGTIEAIAVMSELRDPYTAGHQRLVTQLAVAIACELDVPAEQIQALRVAGLLHDVGKVYVPSEILSKPGKLSDLELNLAKAHAEAGYDIVKTIKFPWPVAHIIRQHHERMDGSGYPQGLKGDQIVLEARILAVADVVEAMMAHRPYRPALGIDKALEEITGKRGILYYVPAVDACVLLFREKGFAFAE
jgi:PAS domain S-box-containing protein/putative nucleotidyltransferase with HDIG domain